MNLSSDKTIENISTVPGLATASRDWINTIGAIRMTYLPVVIVGILTNILNLLVYLHHSMRNLSTVVFLSALAVADLNIMVFETFRMWVEWVPHLVDPALYFTDTYCKTVNFVGNVARDFSNWLIACISVERLIVVGIPLKARRLCTVFRARLLTLTLFVVLCCAHVPTILTSSAVTRVALVCWGPPRRTFISVMTVFTTYIIGNAVIPIVLVLNATLCVLLCRSRRVQSSQDNRMEQTRRLTGMLLGIGILFVVCEMPRFLAVLLYATLNGTNINLRIFMSAANLLSGLNHAANFFIYVLSGGRFREVFFHFCRREGGKGSSGSDKVKSPRGSIATLATISSGL